MTKRSIGHPKPSDLPNGGNFQRLSQAVFGYGFLDSTSGRNFHSINDWVALEWMRAATEKILSILSVWVEKSRG